MGSAVTNFTSIVEAKSLGTADIDKITAAIDKQSASLDKLGTQATKVNEHPGFAGFADKIKQGISNPLQSIESGAVSTLESLGPMGAVVAGVGTAMAAMAYSGYEAAKSLAAYGVQIEDARLRTGLTTQEVVQFGFAAKLVGQDVSVYERGMRGLTAAVTDLSPAGAKARETLQQLGVEPRTLNGELKPTGQLLLEISAALNAMPNAFERNRAGMDIFKRAWIEMGPAILKVSDGVRIANEQGFFGPSDAQLKQFDEYNIKVTSAEARLSRLYRTAKQFLAEVVFPDQDLTKLREAQDAKDRGAPSDIPGPSLPRPPQSSTARSLFAAEAAAIIQDRASGNALLDAARTRMDSTLEGLRLKAEAAKTAYQEAYDNVRTLSGVGAEAAQKEIAHVAVLKSNYEALSQQLKIVEKDESARLAVLEKMRELALTGDRGYQIGSGIDAKVVTGAEIDKNNPTIRTAPSLYSRRAINPFTGLPFAGRESNPFTSVASANAGQQAQSDLPSGLQVLNGQEVFIAGAAERGTQIVGASIDVLNSRWQGFADLRKRDEAVYLAQLQGSTEATARLIELRAGPGGELVAARQTAAVRQAALDQEFRVTNDIAKYRIESRQNELDLTLKIADLEQQRIDSLRNGAGRLFDSLVQGPKGIEQFVTNFALGEARKVFQNLAVDQLKGVSGNLGLSGKLFQGTIFGPDPLKSATDLNTAATIENTAALRMIQMGPSSGGGGFYGASLSGMRDFSVDPFGEGATASDGGSGTAGGWADENRNGVGMSRGLTGLQRNVGIAGAAVAGGYGIYRGIQAGGERGVIEAAGSGVAAVTSILALAGVASKVLGPAGLVAGLGLSFLTSALGDPKQLRAQDEQNTLLGARYTAPTPTNYTVDRYGRQYDTDVMGAARPIINISMPVMAMDSKNIIDQAGNIGDALAGHMEANLLPRLSTAIRNTAFPR